MKISLDDAIEYLAVHELQRLDFDYTCGLKEYRVKAYRVATIIRLDVAEAKEKE